MIPYTTVWERWAALAARLLLAVQFGVGAWFKITMWSGEVAQTAAVGVPLANVAVGAALIFEILLILSLLSGWYVRPMALLAALYVALLAVLFYHDWSNQLNFGFFMSHLGLIAALLYISVFGARSLALRSE